MHSFNPYLTFDGDCEEAFRFYQDCFGGNITIIQRFGDSPMPVPDSHKDKIMHMELEAHPVHLMGSDGSPQHQVMKGNTVTFNLAFHDSAEQETIFNKLAAGGKVSMPLENTFWGSRFGMLTDKFGVHWMLNCQLST
jgi:PhnB protein